MKINTPTMQTRLKVIEKLERNLGVQAGENIKLNWQNVDEIINATLQVLEAYEPEKVQLSDIPTHTLRAIINEV